MKLKKYINNFLITLVLLPIKFYRYFISPLYSANCRFEPTCSAYALDAIKKHGIFYGGFLVIKRLFKCQPFFSCSYHDPVPEKKPKFWPKWL